MKTKTARVTLNCEPEFAARIKMAAKASHRTASAWVAMLAERELEALKREEESAARGKTVRLVAEPSAVYGAKRTPKIRNMDGGKQSA